MQPYSRALDMGGRLQQAIVGVWLHGSAPVAAAAKDVDREVVGIFFTARDKRHSYEEWRELRAPAERALERFIEAVRGELALPSVPVSIRIADITRSP